MFWSCNPFTLLRKCFVLLSVAERHVPCYLVIIVLLIFIIPAHTGGIQNVAVVPCVRYCVRAPRTDLINAIETVETVVCTFIKHCRRANHCEGITNFILKIRGHHCNYYIVNTTEIKPFSVFLSHFAQILFIITVFNLLFLKVRVLWSNLAIMLPNNRG